MVVNELMRSSDALPVQRTVYCTLFDCLLIQGSTFKARNG